MAPAKPKYLLVVGGPTASGKTALAIQLALHFQTEILSADSRQFYREMNIGTAKPSARELALVKHHFIDFLSINEPYSAGHFEKDALQVLTDMFSKTDVAVLVGGTGLYLKAVCEGMDIFPEIPKDMAESVETDFRDKGLPYLQAELQRLDPLYFKQVDLQNPARVKRALVVIRTSGKPFSQFLSANKAERPFTPVYLLVDLPRSELYRRIDARVDQMIKAGLESEAQSLFIFRHEKALRTVGYQEFFDYFEGKISRETAVEKIKQHSRNYAKRQVTWFGKYDEWKKFHPDNFEEILRYLKSIGIPGA